MSFETWLAFSSASMLLLLIPGPTILAVISYSIAHGYKARIPLVLAVALGDSTALALSLLGLGALLAKSVFWFQVVKWAGGLYLIYLGIKLLVSGVKPQSLSAANNDMSRWKLFANTYMLTALNPKGMIFFIAFLPQFIDQSANVSGQLSVLAVTFVSLATLNASMYTLFASRAQHFLSSAKTQRIFNLSGGTLMCAAGTWALATK